MNAGKVWRLSWVAILVVSAFFLGRHLQPDTRQGRRPPPLNLGAPSQPAPPGFGVPQRAPALPPNPGGGR
jgi:hypothetical protein